MLSVGQVLDNRYEILAPLAEGGMGAVYRARRTLLGDEVAIKVVRPDVSHASAADRFLRESRVAASLRHPSIVSILDFDMPAGAPPYLVMELLSGPSLEDEISARGRLDPADIQRILPTICSALHLAHASGIVHRDIKPANIVSHRFGGGERVYKIVDFGIANLRETSDTTRLTGPHQFVGTAAYAAPEQLTGAGVDARSDIYSLAIVVFESLTGRLPFRCDNLLEIVSAHLTTAPPRLKTLRSDIPEWLDAAVARALAKEPSERWQTMAEFGEALAGDAASPAGAATEAAETLSGRLAATYDIAERVGTGRLGSEVFRGVHRTLGHEVAIRILRSGAPGWPTAKERFLREARSLQVAHPSIMQVRDYGEDAGMVYLVTDFVRGRSVRDVLAAEGAIEWNRLRPLLGQLLEAARVLHRRKVLLCGLNPQIIRIQEPDPADPDAVAEGERLLISTGAIGGAEDLLSTLHERTVRGIALEDVELRYIAPELMTGGDVDVRSDVFTIGAVAYEMATGIPPYDGRSMQELLGRMLSGAPMNPRDLRREIPEATAVAMLRALSAKPEERFTTLAEFGRQLFTSK